MEDERYTKPRHRKIDKHLIVTINDKKVRILKHNIHSYYDSFTNCEYHVIELVTKISNEVFKNRKIEISIPKDYKL